MSDPALILHHYAGSPFSEKVRLVLGYKGLAWRSVTVPVILPKPDVLALTGGYRRTPFLQIGADIYCDTALMCQRIDRLAPTPTLYPREAGGTAALIAQWADTDLFWAAAPYTMQPAGIATVFAGVPPEVIKAFGADRMAMSAGVRRAPLADATAALTSYLLWLEQMLADGRDFLCGGLPSIADFAVVHCLWFIRRAGPLAAIMAPHERLAAWYERVRAFGHGQSTAMSSEEAIALAAAANRHAEVEVMPGLGFEPGQALTVTPLDYAFDPVAGELVGLTNDSVTLRRRDERAGIVHVHFPRIGYALRKAEQESKQA
ncbi:glutathione S-transferase family protein [Roseateles violae]|uniref:Glutathione S-transferase family protein n=1 Tax=Roseateles violae TaxID=3058042 RepID=A0ABT8DZ66_9BURK|nr:glutathione S-transferase family protein [Pelomonas sp. PFR6]MDN3922891.1 glutathione S-transferase family protein [Pelomonas sp. PFR6]